MNIMVKKASARRAGGSPLDIGALVITVAIPGYDGLVPVASLSAPIDLTMNNWTGSEELTTVQLMWDGTVNNRDEINEPDARHVITDVEAGDTSVVFQFKISDTFLAAQDDGPHTIYAKATTDGGGVDTTATPIILDRTAPGGGSLPAPKFSGTIEASSEISELDFVDIGGGVFGVPAGVVHYEGIFRGDLVEPMIDGVVYPEGDYDVPDIPNRPVVLPIYYTEAVLRALTPGRHEFYIRVTDKAGNVGIATLPQSKVVLDVQIGIPPGPLLAPLVPAYDDGLVTEADARAPVEVWIPRYNNPRSGDEIEVDWGGAIADKISLKPTDLPNNPIVKIELDYGLVIGRGSGGFNVRYRLYQRNVEVVPISPSPPTPVVADLNTPGGEDPDHDTPIHENLNPLSVQGAGTPTSPPNELTDADLAQQDVTLTIPLWSVDGLYKLEAFDELRVTWGTQAEYTLIPAVSPGEANGALDIPRPFPTSIISRNGSGDAIPVYYTIVRRLSVSPHVATAQSPNRAVKIDSNADLPGGGTIPAPEFPDLFNGTTVGPNELKEYPNVGPGRYNPIRVLLPQGLANVGLNDTIEVTFKGFRNVDGSDGASPVELPLAEFVSLPHLINTEDLDLEYYEVFVPERNHYAICTRGAAEAQVSITNGKGTVPSDWKRVSSQVKCSGWGDCAQWDTLPNYPPCRE
ncbi:MAG: hypothetical protein WCA48_02620 [Pseudomonas gingeri]